MQALNLSSQQVAGFDWDGGNWPKCGKHGVSQSEIEELFTAPFAILPAPDRVSSERRLIAVGTNAAGRTMLVVFTVRERDGEFLIRPVSARFVHERERRHYERQVASAEENSSADE